MTTTLIAALLVGLVAPVVRGLAWGVPFSLLSVGTVLVSFAGSALTVLIIGITVGFLLSGADRPAEQIGLVAGGLGGAGGFLLLLNSARRMRHVRGLSVLCQRLSEEDARESAASALGRLLDRVRRASQERYAALVLMATGPLTQAGLWDVARQRLQSIDDDGLTVAQSVLRNQALATCQLQFDEVVAAEEAIRRIPRPTDDSVEVWLVAMEALVLAVRGEADAALGKLLAQDTTDNPSLQASHRLVHAHILASRQETDAARRELETLRSEAGRAGLARAMHPKGPASELAQELLAADDPA